ncbi:hypothetical protein CLOSTHATH_00549 [Hungatella hathewayi DSM 13479]|uniref:Uncharacterized protein n=1 Tax=Hungatella hathewayi DSM 13479 TaxID=566550 RepID=D3AAC8_9FIRM|nr:hypothetical protein CLOSTHATH_00549 [Hungatella hathewayi DSM 13479]
MVSFQSNGLNAARLKIYMIAGHTVFMIYCNHYRPSGLSAIV